MTVLLVALGAAVGAPLRYAIARAVDARYGLGRGWGILAVNVVGSFVLGVLTGALVSAQWQALFGVGFCGALTTYSAFAMDTVVLAERGERLFAAVSVVTSLIGGLAAALGGVAAGAALATLLGTA